MIHCWASLNESLPEDEYFGQSDKICMLEEGHDGEHEWTPTGEIVIKFISGEGGA